MTDIVDNNRFSPPKAPLVEPTSLDDGPALAGRGMRLVADGLVVDDRQPRGLAPAGGLNRRRAP